MAGVRGKTWHSGVTSNVNGVLERRAGSDEVSELFTGVMAEPLFDSPEWLQIHHFFANHLPSGSHKSVPSKLGKSVLFGVTKRVRMEQQSRSDEGEKSD